jgi:CHAT domain-containing protein
MSRYAVRKVPSLSAYLMQRSRRPVQYAADLALFADPAFRAIEGGGPSASRSGSSRQQRLPWTAREAEHLRTLFAPSRTLVYVGAEATRDNLRSLPVRNSRVLHIASHGFFDASSPDNVGFSLAAVDQPRSTDSGFVTLTELFTYRFNNELVVISGCETAMGEERGGEGLMSLTRGFLAQGAAHVMSTLWPVSDRASADFMGLFYKELIARGSVGEALRNAQVELSRRPQYADPFFWAPYVLTTVIPDDRMTF